MPNTNKNNRLKRFFVDVDTSILQSSYENISISNDYVVYKQKFGKLLILNVVLTLISILFASCLNPLFYLGLLFIPIGIIANKIWPNQEKIYFDHEGICAEGFLHTKKKYLYDEIIDIYSEDSPTRYNVYGLCNNKKVLLGLSLNKKDSEHLINILKAIVTREGKINTEVQN